MPEDSKATGLDVFQDILGRLNGKSSSQLDTTPDLRSNARRSAFIDRRWGTLRFVSGGLLAGDDTERSSKSDTILEPIQKTPPHRSSTVTITDAYDLSDGWLDAADRKSHHKRR